MSDTNMEEAKSRSNDKENVNVHIHNGLDRPLGSSRYNTSSNADNDIGGADPADAAPAATNGAKSATHRKRKSNNQHHKNSHRNHRGRDHSDHNHRDHDRDHRRGRNDRDRDKDRDRDVNRDRDRNRDRSRDERTFQSTNVNASANANTNTNVHVNAPRDDKLGSLQDDPRGSDPTKRITKKASSRGAGRNTESFDPASTLGRPDLRIQLGSNRIERYNKPLKHDDVVIVPELFGEEENWDIYYKLVEEVRELQNKSRKGSEWIPWHEGAHLIAKDVSGSDTYKMIIDRLCQYFNIDRSSRSSKVGTRFNWYRDSSDWKPFHHDSAALNPARAKNQNITIGASFGATRELSFLRAKDYADAGDGSEGGNSNSKCKLYFPQVNNGVFSFGRDANILWKHGVNALPPEEQDGKGRISIILWGLASDVIEEEGSPPLLGSDGKGPHARGGRGHGHGSGRHGGGRGGGRGGGGRHQRQNGRRNHDRGGAQDRGGYDNRDRRDHRGGDGGHDRGGYNNHDQRDHRGGHDRGGYDNRGNDGGRHNNRGGYDNRDRIDHRGNNGGHDGRPSDGKR